jgi:nicotinate-nucleotide adenylyltransferase
MVAGWLRWTEQVDAVWLLPTWKHAFGKDLAPWDARLRMCEALAGTLGTWARVEPIEAELGGTSYTVDTLRALAERHPAHDFRLVVGADVRAQAHLWRSWDTIATRWPPIVVGREGFGDADGAPTFPEVSSTELRARLQAGTEVTGWIPAAVLRVIRAEGLYGASSGAAHAGDTERGA